MAISKAEQQNDCWPIFDVNKLPLSQASRQQFDRIYRDIGTCSGVAQRKIRFAQLDIKAAGRFREILMLEPCLKNILSFPRFRNAH